jgi:hypothetical protein
MQRVFIENLPQISPGEPAVQIGMRAELTNWKSRLERAMTMGAFRNA